MFLGVLISCFFSIFTKCLHFDRIRVFVFTEVVIMLQDHTEAVDWKRGRLVFNFSDLCWVFSIRVCKDWIFRIRVC